MKELLQQFQFCVLYLLSLSRVKKGFYQNSSLAIFSNVTKHIRHFAGVSLLLAGTLSATQAQNQPGSNDMGYNVPGITIGTEGFNRSVLSIALQSDGKAVVGGWFTSFNGTPANYIARLNTDGSPDAAFNSGTGFNDSVSAIVVQNDGKLLIGGYFTFYNGTTRNRIARLNADGSLDNSFNPGTGFDSGPVRSIALQKDGKIVVGGGFNSYNGTVTSRIVRLNSDGSLDPSFSTGTGFDTYSTVWEIVVQKDDKLVVGGWFTTYRGVARNSIVRLHPNGSLDESFNPGTNVNGGVNAIALQDDGKVVVGGFFAPYTGASRYKIARLNSDGTLDTSFSSGDGLHGTGSIRALALQPDGKVIAGGYFTAYNGTARNRIARLNTNGSLDTSFDPGAGFTGAYVAVWALALQADGKIIAGGNFTSFDGVTHNRIIRLHGDVIPLSTSPDLQAKPEVLLYPNPTQGDFNLQFSGAEALVGAAKLTLHDAMGRQVLTQEVSAAEAQAGVTLSTAGQASGVYLLRISTRSGVFMKRLVLTE